MGIKIFSNRIVMISKKNWTFMMSQSGQCPVGIADGLQNISPKKANFAKENSIFRNSLINPNADPGFVSEEYTSK